MKKYLSLVLGVLLTLAAVGCGRIADKDRIRVAKIGDKYITRGDLFKIIREMPDNARPNIRNRSDLLRVLNQHIDARIKIPLGKQLAKEGKVAVPREVAREQFFRESGDEEEHLRTMWNMEIPKQGEITPMMRLFNLTPELLQFNKDIIEEGTDRMLEKLQGDQAVEYLALEALRNGRITVDEEEIRQDYELMKEEFTSLERVRFRGIRFLEQDPSSLANAANIKERIESDLSFDEILSEYAQKGKEDGKSYVFETEMVNHPTMKHFQEFWTAVSGTSAGDIIGPVYLPAFQQIFQDQDGKRSVMPVPAAYVVLQIVEYVPQTILEYEQAKPLVMRQILTAKMMQRLREEHGVEVYPDKLPEPRGASGARRSL